MLADGNWNGFKYTVGNLLTVVQASQMSTDPSPDGTCTFVAVELHKVLHRGSIGVCDRETRRVTGGGQSALMLERAAAERVWFEE